VVAQAVEQLWTVGLGIDRLKLDPLIELAPFRAVGLGGQIDALAAFPHAGQGAQRAEVGQGIGVHVAGFGEDIVRKRAHDPSRDRKGFARRRTAPSRPSLF
jgi:hypothetical protein